MKPTDLYAYTDSGVFELPAGVILSTPEVAEKLADASDSTKFCSSGDKAVSPVLSKF